MKKRERMCYLWMKWYFLTPATRLPIKKITAKQFVAHKFIKQRIPMNHP